MTQKRTNMTKWEIGQDLIAISDFIGEKEVDLRDAGELKLVKQLRLIRMLVGDLFNQNNDHEFMIIDTGDISIPGKGPT